MKYLLTLLICCANAYLPASARTDQFFTTQGEVTIPPQIDALVWTNRDTIRLVTADIEPALYFETQNTERYVNLGRMEISPGVRFENISANGERKAADVFINRGEIRSPGYFNYSGEFDDPIHRIFGGRISIWSDNITNQGYITGLHSGVIDIRGSNVDLTRGGIGNDIISATVYQRYQTADGQLFFNPELGFTDDFWDYDTFDTGANFGFGDSQELIIKEPTDPNITYTNIVSGVYQTFVRKQVISTNVQVFDIALVSVSDTENVLIDVTWVPGAATGLPPVGTAQIHVRALETNVVRGELATNELTFYDSFAARPADALYRNLLTDITFQPTNMFVRRGRPIFVGERTNAIYFASGPVSTFNHWIDSADPITFTNYYPMDNPPNNGVNYCTYDGTIAWQPSQPILPLPVHGSLTNIGGRVSITADSLKLSRARVQGQGAVTIKANNLVNADRLAVDTPILSLDVSSAINDLRIKGIASGSARRLGGSFSMFSLLVSNTFTFTHTNAAADPTQAPTTEAVDYVAFYHITFLDTTLESLRKQIVEDVRLTSDKVTISDPLPVARDLLVDAKELLVESDFGRTNVVDLNLTSSEFPRLEKLEVSDEGKVYTRGLLEGGNIDRELLQIVNYGELEGTGVRLRANSINNSGRITATGGQLELTLGSLTGQDGILSGRYGLSISAETVAVDGLRIRSGGDVVLSFASASFGNSEVVATTSLAVTNLPTIGNFAGVKIIAAPKKFEEVIISWPGDDIGAAVNGYSSASFLEELELTTQPFGGARLRGTGNRNALYVGKLSFSDDVLNALEDYLLIDANLTVYFSETSTNIDPLVLDGFITANGGKLVYLPRADIAGVVNVHVEVGVDGGALELSWDGEAMATYRVESRGLNDSGWAVIGEAKDATGKISRLKFADPILHRDGRLYRVVKSN